MIIKRVSMISNKLHEREIPVSEEEYLDIMTKMQEGVLIQDAAPQLSADDREFLISGSTPEEWNEVFGAAFENLDIDEEWEDESESDQNAPAF